MNYCTNSLMGLLTLIFLILTITISCVKAEEYPDYEFNQRMNESPKKISPQNFARSRHFNKKTLAKNHKEKTNKLLNDNLLEDRDDDIIVTKPVSCIEISGTDPPNCDYMADQSQQIIQPKMSTNKINHKGPDRYDEESSGGYIEVDEDDDEDDDEEDEEEDEDTKDAVIDGRFREEDDEEGYAGTTHRLHGASSHAGSNNHHSYNTYKNDGNKGRMSTISFHIAPSQAPYLNYNNQHNYPRNNHDVSSSYIKDRQYQQLTAKMNILLIAGIAAGIVVLLFILVLAACKFYTSSTGAANAKALNDYQRSANKTAYAYEACNTGAKCSSPLLIPTSQQSLTPLNANSQAGLTNVGSSATNTATKPAKKDVKEWYV